MNILAVTRGTPWDNFYGHRSQWTEDKSPLSTISVGILKFFKTIVRPWQAGVLKNGPWYCKFQQKNAHIKKMTRHCQMSLSQSQSQILKNDKNTFAIHYNKYQKNEPTLPNQNGPSLSKKSYLHTSSNEKRQTEKCEKMTIFFWDITEECPRWQNYRS